MRILINALSARQGGGQTYLLNLLEYLPDQESYEVFVYAPETLELPKHDRLKRCSTGWHTDNPIIRTIWETLYLPLILRKLKIDLLFCPGGLISLLIPDGCKTVTMFRNMMPFDMRVRKKLPYGFQKIRNWILQRAMLKSMAKADLTIFISNFARNMVEQRIALKRAITIPHGINKRFKTHAQNISCSFAAPDNGKYILYVSKFDVYKHQYEVVKAYEYLSNDLRNEYKLLLVGEIDKIESVKVLGVLNNSKMKDQVHIVGPVPYLELPSLYHNASLIIFASSCENCPNILLESLGAGKPIISSDVMPMPEFAGDGAIYFSPFSPKDIADKINSVLTDSNAAEKIGHNALQRSTQFDSEISANKTWQAVFSVLY